MLHIAPKNARKMGISQGVLSDIVPTKKVKNKTKKHKNIFKQSNFSVHYSFVVLMVVGAFLGIFKLLLLYFICLCLHEMVHNYFAKKQGYKLGKIRLSISGAVLDASGDEFAFKDEILIAISAPIFNLLLALLFIAFWWIYPESYNFLQDVVVINLAIFAFNILPFFPLDGGRVLLGVLSKRNSRNVAVKICKSLTIIFGILMFLFFVVSLFISPAFSVGIAGVNLFLSAIIEDRNAAYKRLFYFEKKVEKSKNGGIEGQTIYINKNQPLHSLVKMLDARHFTTFIIVDDYFKPIKSISEVELQDLIIKQNK